MSEEAKVFLAVLAGGLVSLGLCVPSALWMDRVVAPVLRGSEWDWLLMISVLLIVGGTGYLWYRITTWALEKLDTIT